MRYIDDLIFLYGGQSGQNLMCLLDLFPNLWL